MSLSRSDAMNLAVRFGRTEVGNYYLSRQRQLNISEIQLSLPRQENLLMPVPCVETHG
jgi:hypothetical protein